MNFNQIFGSLILIGISAGTVYTESAVSQEVNKHPGEHAALSPDINPVTGTRLPPVKREELDDFGKQQYDAAVKEGRNFEDYAGPRGIRIYSPRVAEYMTMGNQYLRYDADIDPALTELIILTAAREMDNKYEWSSHEKTALEAGLAQEVIDIIKYSKPVDVQLRDEEKVIIELGREILQQHKLSSGTYARALKLFGKKKLIDIVTLLGHYTATAILLTAFDQQLHPGEESTLPDLSD